MSAEDVVLAPMTSTSKLCTPRSPRSRRHVGALAALVFLYIATVPATLACQVPVFRYALERWPGDDYIVIVEYAQPLTAQQTQWVDVLRRGEGPADPPANLQIRVIKSDADPPPPDPTVTLFYPAHSRVGQKEVCRLPLTRQNVTAIRSSPVRQKIAQRLLAGDSAVLVFLTCGDAQKDKLRREQLQNHLVIVEPRLKLPDGMENDPERRLDTAVQLKLAFSIVDVDRNDPAEAVFIAMLLGSEPDLYELDEPMAFPVFGRARALYALVGAGINEHTITDACQFLTGPCSCQVKEGNPGVDLLFSIDWESAIVGSAAPPAPDVDLAELPRLEDLSADTETPNDTSQPEPTTSAAVYAADSLPHPTARDRSPLWRVVGVVICLVAVTAVVALLLGRVVSRRGAAQ